LKQVTGPAASRVDEVGIAAMCFPEAAAHAVCRLRRQHQMHMIWHEAVRPYLDPLFAQLLRKHVAINLLIIVLEEDRFAAIPALSHVMRKVRDDHAS
jgi:hypothetical protein